jgi:transposase
MSVGDVSALFSVDDNSVYRWTAHYKATGSYPSAMEAL